MDGPANLSDDKDIVAQSQADAPIDPILACHKYIALIPHDIMDQCGGRDFGLVTADAILKEHILQKFADMEYHGGQFLHMAFLVEKFITEMKKRSINFNVIFFDCDQYGTVQTEWFKKKVEIDEIDPFTHKKKVIEVPVVKSRFVKHSNTYRLMRRILDWHLQQLGIKTLHFTNWLHDPEWNEFLRDSRPSFIHHTDDSYLPMYYLHTVYNLKLTRKFSFHGNIIYGFGSDTIVESEINRNVVKSIGPRIKVHLKESGISLDMEEESTREVPKTIIDSVNKIASQFSQVFSQDDERLKFVLIAIAHALHSYSEKPVQGLSISMAHQLAQILLSSALLQTTLPLCYRVHSLDEEAEETMIKLTQFVHLVLDASENMICSGSVSMPNMLDFLDGRLFHTISLIYFKNSKYSTAVNIEMPSSLKQCFEASQKFFSEIVPSDQLKKANLEKEWKSLVQLVDAPPKAMKFDETLSPISNPLVDEYLGPIKSCLPQMPVEQYKSLTQYNKELANLYDWKAAVKTSSSKNIESKRRRESREKAKLRLLKYAEALQNGLLQQRTITTDSTDSKSKDKKKLQKQRVKSSVVILQVKNELEKIKEFRKQAEQALAEPSAHKTLLKNLFPQYEVQIRKCFSLWRQTYDLAMESVAGDMAYILQNLWELMKFLATEILKNMVDHVKDIPAKSDRQKWEIFHRASFTFELFKAYQEMGKNYDQEIKLKFTGKHKSKVESYRGMLVDESFYKQLQRQLLLSLTRAGFHRQVEKLEGVENPTKQNEISPWRLELQFHYADNSIARYLPPKKIEIGEKMLDLGFTPDDWQQQLIHHVENWESVLVSAPTSSGKTFIAFYAIEKVLRESDDGVVVFLCPTKALVNQVYAEILAKYSKTYSQENMHMIGMSTGDEQINESSCQVLVTSPGLLEIFMLSPEKTEWKQRLRYVIMDEIHTINEQGGDVWEHLLLMINCPFLALSATLGDPHKFVNWLNKKSLQNERKVALVEYKERPRPLEYSVYKPNFADEKKWLPFYARTSAETKKEEKEQEFKIELDEESTEEDEYDEEDEGEDAEDEDEEEEEDVVDEEQTKTFKPIVKESLDVNSAPGQFTEIHPTSVLNPEKVIIDEIKNMFLMSPKHCLDLYEASESYANSNNLPNLFAPCSPESLEQIALLNPQQFIEYRRHMNDRLIELAEDPKNHRHLLDIFAILRKEVDSSFSEIYSHVDVTQYNSEEYLYDNIIGLVRRLREQNMLPAIIFNLDHNFIDQLMALISDYVQYENFNLWETEKEKRKCQTLIRSSCESLTGVDESYITALQNGIAVHYNQAPTTYAMEAERLFRARTVPIFISTATLALGINMPCKTVVIAGQSIYLSTTYFNQMSGRAGRRGFDTRGNVVLYGIPRISINRYMTSPNPQILGTTGVSASFILRLMMIYANQTTDQNRRFVYDEIVRILSRPQYIQDDAHDENNEEIQRKKELLSVEQTRYQFMFHLDCLSRLGLLDEKAQPRDFAGLVSRLSTHEPFNFIFSYFILKGLFHAYLTKESQEVKHRRNEQAQIMKERKQQQLREIEMEIRNRKRTGKLRKKYEKENRDLQRKFDEEVQSVFEIQTQEEIMQLISYLFCRSEVYNGTDESSQVAKAHNLFNLTPNWSVSDEYEYQQKMAECNTLPSMHQRFEDVAQQFYNTVVGVYRNFLVSYGRHFLASIIDEYLPRTKRRFAVTPFVEELKEIDVMIPVEPTEHVVEEEKEAEEESDDDLQWDESGSDEEEAVEEKKPVESDTSGQPDVNSIQKETIHQLHKTPELHGIEKELADMSLQSVSVSAFAALSGWNDDSYDSTEKLIYISKHTIPIDVAGIPAKSVFGPPLNSMLFDFYKHGSYDRLRDNNLVTNLNQARSTMQRMLKDTRAVCFGLTDVKKPQANIDDVLALLLNKVSKNLNQKVNGERRPFRPDQKKPSIRLDAEDALAGKAEEKKWETDKSNPEDEGGFRTKKKKHGGGGKRDQF